jgi:UDP-N-acetylglucosamine 2-epimerase (non-hydrolysing)
VTLGTNTLVGNNKEKLLSEVGRILEGKQKPSAIPPLWDGHAAERIADAIASRS